MAAYFLRLKQCDLIFEISLVLLVFFFSSTNEVTFETLSILHFFFCGPLSKFHGPFNSISLNIILKRIIRKFIKFYQSEKFNEQFIGHVDKLYREIFRRHPE